MNQSYLLDNGLLRCTIIPYGAILQSLFVPDQTGKPVDIVLGCDTPGDYALSPDCMGAIVGRYANRISGAAFSLDGIRYPLSDNCNGNHIHGGFCGFQEREWVVEEYTPDAITLSIVSEDGEEGYPGQLTCKVCYRLFFNELHISYDGISDKDTICNLTNHSYFNLDGHGSGSVLQQKLQIFADAYLPTRPDGVPLGELTPVENTPMDFRKLHAIGENIDSPVEQIRQSGGYDHCFAVNGMPGSLRKAAAATAAISGISMEIFTDCPGIQLYTANGLEPNRRGKNGGLYGPQEAFCLETQYFPNSPNETAFPSPVLRKGEHYKSETVWRFSVI